MKKIRACIFLILAAAFLLSACNLPKKQTETVEPNGPSAVQTAAAMTVEAFANQVEDTPAAATSVPTVQPPTATPQPTQALPTTVPTTAAPCDRASFVTDVTIEDGTKLDPNEKFIKTWRLKNNGTCTWSTSYALVFTSGNAMSGPVSMPLPKNVAPGETIDLSVELTAPSKSDTYRGDWKLRNASGAVFGIGDKADQPFYVEIVIGEQSFAVTSASTTVDTKNFTGSCPHTFNFEAVIKATAGGTVTYYWERSDGSKSSTKSITFSEAGEKTVTNDWTFGGAGNSYSEWMRLYIDTPNHQFFPKAEFNLTCNP